MLASLNCHALKICFLEHISGNLISEIIFSRTLKYFWDPVFTAGLVGP